MDHSEHTPLGSDELTSDTLKGATIYGADDAAVGHVSHLVGSGAACQVIVDVGGFLGLGAKPVAVGLGQLSFMRDAEGMVHAATGWTEEQLLSMPAYAE
ncbi:PRC-barrel domain-containing protein [Devosia beringensis]|uniref:PRC-barrel domain-containing protein n=1 Tax=Devosia beringensis TaxID=2657486 RepID=UPI00186B90C3|nr:PRC-barrel domain-containing protein [Devosia beringensis]